VLGKEEVIFSTPGLRVQEIVIVIGLGIYRI
jgi:hypothetical protein